jgi:16S rRNA (guanine527-N7)-methyltransferase
VTVAGIAGMDWTADISAETMSRLEVHVAMLHKWNPAINLVAPASLKDAWTRHVSDSVQLFDLGGDNCKHWADLGSGAGFPGLVVACLAAQRAPEMRVTLVESDHRKAEFLRSVSRETGVAVRVLDSRIEALPPLEADVVSARALAPLPALCAYAVRHLAPSGRALFLKGARAEEEVRSARIAWRFDLESRPSATDPAGSVLILTDLQHA